MMTIGAFSRATGLSAKALRSYDRLGLLSPARVDPETRYRLYAPEQVADGCAIRLLRELEVPLLEIRPMLEAHPETLRKLLLSHQRRLALRSTRLSHVLTRLQRLIEGKETLVNDATVDPVEATHRRLAVDLFNRSWRLLEPSHEVRTSVPVHTPRSAEPSRHCTMRTAASSSSEQVATASRTGISRRRSGSSPAPTSPPATRPKPRTTQSSRARSWQRSPTPTTVR